ERADTSPAGLDLGAHFTIPFRAPAAVGGYLRGLAAAAGDPGAALRLAAEVERLPTRTGSPPTAFLARGIRAEAALGSAREVRAALGTAIPPAWYIDAVATPFVSGPRERWRLAEALERLGRPEEAAAGYGTFGGFSFYDVAFLAPAERRLALLAERRADYGRARRHWARFAVLWRDAGPALQPLVVEARRKAGIPDPQPSTGTRMSPSR
ncbi:MAG TPA: hypothetical protein VJ773_10310, partial [Gemmatimonadales bacterium]|nr:hypothetical protein [Gemmatimonadales bacterium]